MYEETLDKKARPLLSLFERFGGYYLVGGTALALQIGHRVSVDFNFFCFDEQAHNLLPRVKRVFSGYAISVTYATPEQLNLIIDGVKVTFFHYPYPVVEPLVIYKKIIIQSIRWEYPDKSF